MSNRTKGPVVGDTFIEKRDLSLNKVRRDDVRMSEGHDEIRVLIGLGSRTNSDK